MRTHLITVGNELLSGRTTNTNASFIGKVLGPLGAPVCEITVVGDDRNAIVCAIRRAADEHDVVVISGGLGPTHDDITKTAIAEALDVELVFDQKAIDQIESRYERLGRSVSEAARSMAITPAGAILLENHWGTAPGLYLRHGKALVFAVPGVPREMRGLVTEGIIPVLRSLPGLTPVYVRAIATAGVPESTLADEIADLIPGSESGISLAFLPGYAGVELRLTSMHDEADLERVAVQIRERLGKIVLGDAEEVDLVAAVAKILHSRGATLATAESCTGGMIGKLLTDRPGSSSYYIGGVVVYSNALKEKLLGVPAEMLAEFGAVSEQVAAAMASGAQKRLGADYALSVTGIAGPDGGTDLKPVGLIYLGLAHAEGVITRRLRLSNDREQNRERAAYSALNLLRRHLIGDLTS